MCMLFRHAFAALIHHKLEGFFRKSESFFRKSECFFRRCGRLLPMSAGFCMYLSFQKWCSFTYGSSRASFSPSVAAWIYIPELRLSHKSSAITGAAPQMRVIFKDHTVHTCILCSYFFLPDDYQKVGYKLLVYIRYNVCWFGVCLTA